MGYDTLANIRAEIISRPKNSILFEDLISNKFGGLVTRCVNMAQIKYYETKRLNNTNFEKQASLTLPAGVAFGANSKQYMLDSTTTPVLTAGLLKLKKLWITGTTGKKTDTKSTFDSEDFEGSGIPDDNTVITTDDVYHEIVGEGANMQLLIVIGTAAQDTTPKVGYVYVPSLSLAALDTDSVDIPYGDFLTSFMPSLNGYLKQYVGFDGY